MRYPRFRNFLFPSNFPTQALPKPSGTQMIATPSDSTFGGGLKLSPIPPLNSAGVSARCCPQTGKRAVPDAMPTCRSQLFRFRLDTSRESKRLAHATPEPDFRMSFGMASSTKSFDGNYSRCLNMTQYRLSDRRIPVMA